MPVRKATATWEGGLFGGRGRFRSASGLIEAPVTAGARFQEDPGTNPEELLAAAHASCFSMALSAALEKEGHTPERIETEAACTLEAQGGGYRIVRMELRTRVKAPGLGQEAFERVAQMSKEGCPVSRALIGNLEIELDAQLV